MDLFAGIGGSGVAARKQGITCVYANENNKFSVKTYERNHCRAGPGMLKVDNRDIEEVVACIMSSPSSSVPRATILFAGFPCQSFSKQGKQEGLDSKKYGHFLYEIMKLLIHQRNPIVVLENVKEFATNERFEAMKVVNQEFEELGYYVSTHIYNSVDFNLPQNRERLFIVAVRKDLATGPFEFKNPPSRGQNPALTDFLDPPRPFENRDQCTRINGVWVPNWTIDGQKAELAWNSKKERTVFQGLRKVGRWVTGGRKKGWNSGRTVYHHSGFASCITTGSGNWYQVPGPDGMEDIIRQLSLREALRLQGFYEGFELCVSAHQARRQIGNAVAPPIVSWILRCLRDQYPDILESDTYSTTEVWPQVQAPERSPEDELLIHEQLKKLDARRKDAQKRREIQRDLRETMGQATGTRPGAGKTSATNTKRLSKSDEDEDEISAALKTKLRISSGEIIDPKGDFKQLS